MNRVIELNWEIGFAKKKGEKPEKLYPATVPGAVQLDVAKAEKYKPYWYADNWKDYLWMEDCYWTYRAEFPKPGLSNNQHLLFISKGIDYQYDIFVNGQNIHSYEGMFRHVELDITSYLAENNILEILIYPVPKSQTQNRDRSQADQSCKPAVSYGWDWHPRLIPLGIWDETFLSVVPATRIAESEVRYALNESLTEAQLNLSVHTLHSAKKCQVRWSILDPAGKKTAELLIPVDGNTTVAKLSLGSIQLWWPHNYGDQPLYTSKTELLAEHEVLDSREQMIGFRRMELVMNEGCWNEPLDFPKSRSNAPITVEINGQRIFTKGSNWVPPEIFPGTITEGRYRELLEKAAEANLDMLRVWGGGITNKESFYRICDKKGLLVWQEFPLACNNYRGTEPYLITLENEARSIILRLRNHPSVVLWCGGNELFNAWSGMTDQSKAIRLLDKLCYELDPETPFLPTAPVTGMGHGPYGFIDPVTREELFVKMRNARNTAYSECSSTGPASVALIKKVIPAGDLFPPKPDSAWTDHHGFGAWDAEPESHLLLSMLEKYFGPAASLEALVENGQFIQTAGMKCLFEEGRRQKPYCSMVLTWCYNEPWPCVAGGSAVSWPLEPKPAYFAMMKSCRPVLASAQIKKLVWNEGETFEAPVWLLNDSLSEIKSCIVTVYLEGDSRIKLLSWNCPAAPYNKNIPGPEAKAILPAWKCDRFSLKIEVEGHPEWNSEYELLFRKKATAGSGSRGMNV